MSCRTRYDKIIKRNCIISWKGGFIMARRDDMTKVSFRVSIDEKNKLIKFAEENDLTISQIIRRSVKMFLDSQEAKDEE